MQKSREGAKDAEGSIGTTTRMPDRMAEKGKAFCSGQLLKEWRKAQERVAERVCGLGAWEDGFAVMVKAG